MNQISIYLAGSIKKSHEKANETFWTDEDMTFLRSQLNEFEISFLNPAFRTDDLTDQRSVFGRDMTQVFCSDVVFVDARDRRGLGVGAEMMWAKFNQIPIVTLSPKNTHYNKSKTILLDVAVDNWIHPFIDSLSDIIVENLFDGAKWIRKFANGEIQQVKNIESIRSAMHHYRESQLLYDKPMNELIQSNKKLQDRIWNENKLINAL